VRKGPEADQLVLTMLWMTPTWRQVIPGEDRPQVNKTMKNDVIRLGTMRDEGPRRPDSEDVRTTPAAGTWLLNFNELYYAYAVVGPWRLCGGMNPSCERWELLQVSMGLPYTP
jgi:hypothetical protein